MVLDPQTHFGHSFAEMMNNQSKGDLHSEIRVVYDVQTFEIS
jgi:hypothetical protein